MGSIIKVILYAILIIAISYIIPGIVVAGFWPTAIIVGLAFALVNALIRALLPDNIIFGIVAIILNAVAFWLIGVYVNDFSVTTYLAAFLGSLVASIGVWLINEIL